MHMSPKHTTRALSLGTTRTPSFAADGMAPFGATILTSWSQSGIYVHKVTEATETP